MKIERCKSILLCLKLILLVISFNCQAALTMSPWTDIFKGVQHATGWTDTPRLQRVTAVRIDLQDPDIAFVTTPSNGSEPEDTNRQTGSQFMAGSGVQIAINTQFYESPSGINYADLLGVSVSCGQIVSALENRNDRACTLLITQNNQARFQHTYTSTDLTSVWTAIESFSYILVNGSPWIDYGDPLATNAHPRSAVGISYNQRYLILLTIDGRQTGYSEGATFYEEAIWLIRFGAYNGLNLDGGGSTHMLMSDGHGGSITLNSPSENRAVGSHLGVYAASLIQEFDDVYVYADFENGNEGKFSYSPGYSGSTTGINESLSTADAISTESRAGNWSQRLMIYDDSTVSGGWLVRHVSGGSATRSENVIRPTNGFVGLYAKTTALGKAISIAIDNTNNITADRGVFWPLISDGQWHLYEWNLEDNSHWTGWNNGDGIIDTPDFTIDSIQITGGDSDAEIFIDHIAHSNDISLAYLFSIPGDYEPDGDVDFIDFARFSADWLKTSNFNPISDMHNSENYIIDLFDLSVFAQNWLNGLN